MNYRLILKVLGTAVSIGLLLQGLWLVRGALYPFVLAFLLAYLLKPAAEFLQSYGWGRLTAIIAIYAAGLLGAVAAAGLALPVFLAELERLPADLPQQLEHIQQWLTVVLDYYYNSPLPAALRTVIDDELLIMQEDSRQLMAGLIAGLAWLVRNFAGLALTPVLAFYILYDWPQLKQQAAQLVPGSWRPAGTALLTDLDSVLSGVIRGQLTVAALVGAAATAGLLVLQVKFAMLLGLTAAILDLIPYFGAVLGAVPAVLIALLDSPLLAGKVVLLFIIIQQIEGNLIQPRIVGKEAGLHPLAVIFCVYAGGETAGAAGMLCSVPAAAALKVILQHLLRKIL